MSETISDVIISLESFFQNNKKIKLLEKENYLDLIINLMHPLCPKVKFKINMKKKNTSESIEEIYEILKKQQNEIDSLKDRIKQQETENNKIKKKKKKKSNLSWNSKIILNDINLENTIKDWINPKSKIKFELLFRKSRDGSNGKDFHNFCDNKGPTLTLIQTGNGLKFGG